MPAYIAAIDFLVFVVGLGGTCGEALVFEAFGGLYVLDLRLKAISRRSTRIRFVHGI